MAKDDGRRTWHEFDDYDQLGRKYTEAYIKELGESQGLDPTDPRYQAADTGSQEPFDPDGKFLKEALRRANDNFDFRMAQQAARLSAGEEKYGFVDKKWSEMTDDEREKAGSREMHMSNKEAGMIPSTRFANVPSSISSLEDNFNANKFMVDTYNNEGLGDKDFIGYGTPEQRAAVKDYFVDLDRANFSPIDEVEEPESTTPLSDKYASKDAPLSEELQAAQDFLNDHVAMLRDGTYNDGPQGWRRMASGSGPTSGGSTAMSDALQAATGEIDVNEFAKQRNIRSNALTNDFSRTMGRNIFGNKAFSNSIFS